MRVIIEPDYAALSKWAANYVANKIIEANPTPEKPFVAKNAIDGKILTHLSFYLQKRAK